MPISLFYVYADVSDVDGLAALLRPLGAAHDLAGRVRVSKEGLNATVGGTHAGLSILHDLVQEQFPDVAVDFKVSNDGGAEKLNGEWRVRVVDEVVTLGPDGKGLSWRDASAHINVEQFRKEIITDACDTVVLDVRNGYESAIGRFDKAILPPIRQFSDFGAFVRDNQTLFDGRRVLMYCTGGVRCEKASALVKRECNVTSVAQLHGGIERFLERFPDGGGVFKGKNLVFDGRMAVGECTGSVVGRCLSCDGPWDDYGPAWRCCKCRSRVLICPRDECATMWQLDRQAMCSVCLESASVL